MSAKKIEIVPYNPEWPRWFGMIQKKLTDCLGELALGVEHIGSTSVPGLGAKNRIDVQVTLASLSPDTKEKIDMALERAGFPRTRLETDHRPPNDTHKPEEWKKLYFSSAHPGLPFRANVHFRQQGFPNHEYALLFRDYLRAHPESAAAYEKLKRTLTEFHADNIVAYTDIKDPACDIIMSAARLWHR